MMMMMMMIHGLFAYGNQMKFVNFVFSILLMLFSFLLIVFQIQLFTVLCNKTYTKRPMFGSVLLLNQANLKCVLC